jgi:hypothetical protein
MPKDTVTSISPLYKVGQSIVAKINGVPHEAKIRAVLDSTEGTKLIVDFGFQQVATVSERDAVRLED